MDNTIWAKMHGATTHFPFAMALSSGALDLVGTIFRDKPVARDLHSAGYWTLLLGAVGSVPAVFSGLFMTKGRLLGHGALRLHHMFVWPAFALLIGLATWRIIVGRSAAPRNPLGYLGVMAVAAICILGAGYWGGEMMIAA